MWNYPNYTMNSVSNVQRVKKFKDRCLAKAGGDKEHRKTARALLLNQRPATRPAFWDFATALDFQEP
jgi:hypothetical protein